MRDLEVINAINADPATYHAAMATRRSTNGTYAVIWVGRWPHPTADAFEDGERFTTFVKPGEFGHSEWPLHKDSWALMAQAEQFDAEEIFDAVEIISIIGVNDVGEMFILDQFIEEE